MAQGRASALHAEAQRRYPSVQQWPAAGMVMREDPFETTVKRRLPALAAIISACLVPPAGFLALVSPMAMAAGPSAAGWTLVAFLIAQPPLLVASVFAGFLCRNRFTRTRFAVAILPPIIALAGFKLLSVF